MFGDRFFGLEEIDELLMADGGMAEELGATLVWTLIGRVCRSDMVRGIVLGCMDGEPESCVVVWLRVDMAEEQGQVRNR